MRAPLSWLRDFAPIGGEPAELAAALSGLGLVVDAVELVGEGLSDVVVARVLATRPHPRADRVQLVDVDAGEGSDRQVVCGAFNFAAGDLVPLAPAGSRLPGGVEIGRRKVRGEWSEGMLCSPAELGLSDDSAGILVLGSDADHAPGTALVEALGITADVVFDLDVTPNRPDALSVAGVARDLAAHLGLPYEIPAPPTPGGGAGRAASLVVEAPDLCPVFTTTVLEGVRVGESPTWLARRLTLAGMRPISNLVDVSNYVMLELGQPNHAYDLDRLPGGGLLVRQGRPGEILVTLDRVERGLGPGDCVIADATGEAVGIGGIMGGASSEISPSTATVVLEAAWFSPMAVARTSKRLALRTEASVRFERGVDPEGVERAAARFVELARAVAGDDVLSGPVDRTGELPDRRRVRLRPARVEAILGTTLPAESIRHLITPLGFGCEGDGADLDVEIPSWRPDCEREIDVIEEVARHHGYARIPRTLPSVRRGTGLTAYQRDRRRVLEILVGTGCSEAWTPSFLSPAALSRAGLPPAAVEVDNPLTADERLLRPSLLPGLLGALATNAGVRRPEVALFEVGHVFRPPAAADAVLPDEHESLAVALGSADAAAVVRIWRTLGGGLRLASAELVTGQAEGLHPTRCARVLVDGRDIGALGEVDPAVVAAHELEGRVGWMEVDVGGLLGAARRPPVHRPVSRYPSSDLDLAFVVAEAKSAVDVEQTLVEAGGDLVESVVLFDVFRGGNVGEGRRSLAFRLRLSALDHTLTDEEIGQLRDRCIGVVEARHGAQLRR